MDWRAKSAVPAPCVILAAEILASGMGLDEELIEPHVLYRCDGC